MVTVIGARSVAGRRIARLVQAGTSALARAATKSRPVSKGLLTGDGPVVGDGLACLAEAPAPAGAEEGGFSPATRYTRLLAHGYEITVADATTIASGIADQKPITLCQLKSRAFSETRRNISTLLNAGHDRLRGNQR